MYTHPVLALLEPQILLGEENVVMDDKMTTNIETLIWSDTVSITML